LSDSPHQTIVKNTDFGHFISLDEINPMFSFKNIFKIIFAAVFCPKNLAIAQKILL